MLTLACIALGACLYRWRGHGKVSGPRWLKLVLTAAFLALPAALECGLAFRASWGGLIVLAGFLAALWGLSRGHGQYFDEGTTAPNPDHEEDPYIRGHNEEAWAAFLRSVFRSGTLFGSRAAYEYLLLGISGLAATLGPGVALALAGVHVGSPMYAEATCLALSGALKASAYAIGWRVASGPRATAVGEWLTGAGMGLGVGVGLG